MGAAPGGHLEPALPVGPGRLVAAVDLPVERISLGVVVGSHELVCPHHVWLCQRALKPGNSRLGSLRGAVRGVLVGTAAVAREAACWPQQGRVRPQGRDEPRHPLGTKVAVKPF